MTNMQTNTNQEIWSIDKDLVNRIQCGGRGGGRQCNIGSVWYCWTHGLKRHTIQQCISPDAFHKRGAMLQKRMGGSEIGM